MTRAIRLLADDGSGSSAAEMALSLPIFLALLFGSVELGNFFLSEHVVQKGVRDAARYAARLPITDYPACTQTSDAETRIQRVARTGRPDGTDQRIAGWDSDDQVTVTVACLTDSGLGYVNKGIYRDFPSGGRVPVITVSASVPYPSLFGTLGIGSPSLTLNAQSQSAAYGA